MINIDKLNGKIAENRLTKEKLAKAMGISSRVLSIKLKKGIFNNIEIEKLVEILKIDNPMEIFFDNFMS